jgi:hypothetical protein
VRQLSPHRTSAASSTAATTSTSTATATATTTTTATTTATTAATRASTTAAVASTCGGGATGTTAARSSGGDTATRSSGNSVAGCRSRARRRWRNRRQSDVSRACARLHGSLVLGEKPGPIFFRDGRTHVFAVRAALLMGHQLPTVDVGIAMQRRGKGRLSGRHFHALLRRSMH